MSESQAEMPRYQCHKKVWALKIKAVYPNIVSTLNATPGGTIEPADEGYHPFTVSQDWIDKHKPQAGGYYVVYEDGYKSYSPAKAFEEGYTRI